MYLSNVQLQLSNLMTWLLERFPSSRIVFVIPRQASRNETAIVVKTSEDKIDEVKLC